MARSARMDLQVVSASVFTAREGLLPHRSEKARREVHFRNNSHLGNYIVPQYARAS
jgi:hypothetical protein